jgi:hypothetical protein
MTQIRPIAGLIGLALVALTWAVGAEVIGSVATKPKNSITVVPIRPWATPGGGAGPGEMPAPGPVQ